MARGDAAIPGVRAVGCAGCRSLHRGSLDSGAADANARDGDELMRRTLLLLLVCVSAYADGGRVVLREQAGSFVVTVFAAPADVSVMVQNRTSQRPVLDAAVSIRIGDGELRATHEQAQN